VPQPYGPPRPVTGIALPFFKVRNGRNDMRFEIDVKIKKNKVCERGD
jgi:hypothetical protein